MGSPDHQDRYEYENPLVARYASGEMSRLFSAQTKHATWRRLWVALAETQRELGLNIAAEQIEALRSAVETIDFDKAAEYERQFRHDVMAHVHTFGDQCPEARGIIHLGATSCFVTDNGELIQFRRALELIRRRLLAVIDGLARFAEQYRDLPCLAFTHFQPAQPTTVGKRAALWCYDLLLDLEELEHRLNRLAFRGTKGATGTQASFLQLFDGDHHKVQELDRRLAEKMGFEASYLLTGQTYPRKVDAQILEALSGIGQSAHKMGTDLRLLQHRRELEEPFGERQVGSSAMAYKRNPMRAERMCSLARFAMNLAANATETASLQWMERTLDDSAGRRLSLPQAFLAVDAVLLLYRNLVEGLVLYPTVIRANLQRELPFLATEEILMAGVRAGGNRQELHERIRTHSQEAARQMKEHGRENDLIDRLAQDPAFAGIDLAETLDPRQYVGRAPQQVDELLSQRIAPLRERYAEELGDDAEEIRV